MEGWLVAYGCVLQVYDNLVVGHESEKESLEAELERLHAEVEEQATRYHTIATGERITDTLLERATDDSAIKRYKSRVAAEEERTKALRAQQREVKDRYEPNKVQQALFRDLKKLLSLKSTLYNEVRQVIAAPGADC